MKKLVIEYEIPYYVNGKQEGYLFKTAELYFKSEITGTFQDWIKEAKYQEFCAAAHQCAQKNDWTYFKGLKQPINKVVADTFIGYEHIPLNALLKANEISIKTIEVLPNALGKVYNGVFYGETLHRDNWLAMSGFTLNDFFI
jgi:hypothetical protein